MKVEVLIIEKREDEIMTNEEILNKLKQCVLDYDLEAAKETAKEALEAGIDPMEAIKKGLYLGLKEIADEYEETYFITGLFYLFLEF